MELPTWPPLQVRDAGDGKAFAAEIEKKTGKKVDHFRRRGSAAGAGVIAGVPEADGLMGDLGAAWNWSRSTRASSAST